MEDLVESDLSAWCIPRQLGMRVSLNYDIGYAVDMDVGDAYCNRGNLLRC